ncbi:hypothetical protein LSTR_LSTR015311 [Laodelphax striatellus]|uniref:Uncharacterized protein n=1 Tax=Laodelphax striatellus TaxID=195883 RepID=A0A482WVE5_LAOST|nr:hypothetical protein LSTR_LSTR015311 [Laodelphax striatellus]
MADSSMNEPPEKKARIESSKDAATANGSDLVDSTTKNDPGTKKTVPLIDLVSDPDPETDKTIESNDYEGDKEDETEKTVQSDEDEEDETEKTVQSDEDEDEDDEEGGGDVDSETEKTVESDDEERDGDPETEKTVESDDEERGKGDTDNVIPDSDEDILVLDADDSSKINTSLEVIPSSDKSAPEDDNTGEEKSNNTEDVFDDNYTRSSDEEEENEETQEDNKKEIPLEPFNMDEEKEMGSFDKDFNFTWKTKSREPTDAWLSNEGAKPLDKNVKRPAEEPAKEKEVTPSPTLQELRELLTNILFYMRNNDTVQFTINRMSNPLAASASARLALKKAGGSYQVTDTNNKSKELHAFLSYVTKLPVAADVYTLTRRQLLDILESEADLKAFRSKAYPPLLIDITEDSDGEPEGMKSKKTKKEVLVSVSSSDEEEEDDDDDDEKDSQSKPSRTNGKEFDMFAE